MTSATDMHIVYLSGSPRKGGNSDTLAQYFLNYCQQRGATISAFQLNDLNYRGCQACDGCKKSSETCVLNDDLTEVLAQVAAADLLVLASPIYYGDVSAQLKAFIDRTYSFLKPGYIAMQQPNRFDIPKNLVFILAQGHRNAQCFADILPRYSDIFRWTGFAKTWPIRAIDVYHRGDIDNKDAVFVEVEQVADEVMSANKASG